MDDRTCEKVRLAAMARLEGEEGHETTEEVEAHLTVCGDCRREIEGLEAVMRDLEGHRLGPEASNLWPRVREGIARPTRKDAPWWILPLLASLFPAYRVLDLTWDPGAFSPLRVVPLLLAIALVPLLGGNPFAVNPTLELEGASR